MTKGFIISAPASSSGKTTVTLGVLRALKKRGLTVQPLKSGPDYIDPAFHKVAAGRPSYNIDAWSMSADMIATHISYGQDADLIIAEGSMGLFDGGVPSAYGRSGSAGDIAKLTGWPVILVMNVAGQAQSSAAIAEGFSNFDPDVKIGGVILNQVASARHESLIRTSMEARGIKVLGVVKRNGEHELPSRHLGLVQADEIQTLDAMIERLSTVASEEIDIEALLECATQSQLPLGKADFIAPPAQRIALARDHAFSFLYPHHLRAWQDQGAEILPFSPLANEAPNPDADIVWLPGGYPELHAGALAAADHFRQGMQAFAKHKPVHGECGGYMALGQAIIDKDGERHEMLGLLGLVTSYEKRKFNLGYRRALFPKPLYEGISKQLYGHEFHYSSIIEQNDEPLAEVYDASGNAVAQTGSKRGNVTGSFFHMIGEVAP